MVNWLGCLTRSPGKQKMPSSYRPTLVSVAGNYVATADRVRSLDGRGCAMRRGNHTFTDSMLSAGRPLAASLSSAKTGCCGNPPPESHESDAHTYNCWSLHVTKTTQPSHTINPGRSSVLCRKGKLA